jgi:Zn-finger nucleic acid-binding protein
MTSQASNHWLAIRNQSMNCPVCKSTELVSTDLESNLTSFNCNGCGGNWIRGAEYWKWLEQNSSDLAERLYQEESLHLAEPGKPIDCPECRFRMVKFLVGRGLDFTVDHCEGCKGIWLDQNEWEALKKRNLHDDLNSIFTSFWQTGAQREIRKKKLEGIYVSRFGAEDYAEIKRIRWWLDTKMNKEELLAFLTDRDPFNA